MGRKDKSRYEWLQEYLDLEERCRYLRWQIRKVKREEQRWEDGDLSRIRLNKRSRGAHVLDQLPPLQAELDDCESDRKELLELVDSFHGYEHDFLKMHYIEGMTLEDIADDPSFPYGIDWIYKKSAELHRRLDFLDQWESNKQEFEGRLDVEIGDCIPLF
ncbi:MULTISPECIES: sigma-70 family RNA polymerase sigma factor [unclassified Levilactobacillus]|uniref:sigma-70 family RNA polymerase sigma factor n=1 Tax=unclassified Levilactobacillus TaxID=2767918 RepID=UPI002FEFD7B0